MPKPTAVSYAAASGAVVGIGNGGAVAAPVTEFIGAPTSGTTPLAVTFTNQTTGGVTSWAWTFGDGGSSASQNPSHVYSAAGTYTVSLTATGPGGANTRTRTAYVAAATATATTATLTGPSSGATGVAATFAIALDGPAPAGGVSVAITAPGATLSASTLSWAAGASAAQTFTVTRATDGTTSVDFTVTTGGLARAGRPASFTTAAAASWQADWLARSTAAGVVWAHGFDADAEVTQHLAGSVDPVDHPVPVRRVVDGAGYGCLEQVMIGARLAAAYTAGGTTMQIDDPTLWPNPASTGPFYILAAKAYPAAPDKNLFRCTARSGTTLTVEYVARADSAFAPTAQSYGVGDYLGNENASEWRRTFARLPAGENGQATDDPGAAGAVPLRSKLTGNANSVPRDASYWQYGWYGHSSNHTTWADWTPWTGTTTYTPRGVSQGVAAKYRLWDGTEFYLQFRLKIDPRFLQHHAQPASTTDYWIRKCWALQSEVSSLNQLVSDIGPSNIWYIPSTPAMPVVLRTYKDTKVIGYDDTPGRAHKSYQLAGPWDVAPHFADLTTSGKPSTGCATPDGAAAFEYPDNAEWVTFHLYCKPGRSGVAETEIKVEFALQDRPDYAGTYTTLMHATDATIVYSGSGDFDYPDGAFAYPAVQRMDALPGYQAFGLMGYLNLFQAAGWVPPRASYYVRMAQVIFSQAPIAAPAVAAKPAWLQAMTVGRWAQLGTANLLTDLDPDLDPEVNPNYPATAFGIPVAPWRPAGVSAGHFVNITDWCGAGNDTDRMRMTWHESGGHNSLWDNGAYALELARDVPAYVRLRKPSGAIGMGTLDYVAEHATDVGYAGGTHAAYSDGRLRTHHTLNGPFFWPGRGVGQVSEIILAPSGGADFGAAGNSSTGIDRPHLYSPGTGELAFVGATKFNNAGGAYVAACYDSARNAVWKMPGTSGSSPISYWGGPAANSWTDRGSGIYLNGSVSLCYVPGLDLILVGQGGDDLGSPHQTIAGGWAIVDPVDGQWYYPAFTGAPALNSPWSTGLWPGLCQPQWAPSLGAVLAWDNSSGSTTQVMRITPPASGNPRTTAWTVDYLPVDGGNTVTPSAALAAGTYGRFGVYDRMRVCVVQNAANERPYVFKYGS